MLESSLLEKLKLVHRPAKLWRVVCLPTGICAGWCKGEEVLSPLKPHEGSQDLSWWRTGYYLHLDVRPLYSCLPSVCTQKKKTVVRREKLGGRAGISTIYSAGKTKTTPPWISKDSDQPDTGYITFMPYGYPNWQKTLESL